MSEGQHKRSSIGIGQSDAGVRLDRALARLRPELSRTQWKSLISLNAVSVDGRPAPKSHELTAGETLSIDEAAVELLLRPDLAPWPEAFAGSGSQGAAPFILIAQTPDFVAVSKPAGIPAHPHTAGERHTALNALLAVDPAIGSAGADPLEGGLLHRLDTDTSGVLVAARNPAAYEKLKTLLRGGQSSKFYLAFVHGDMERETLAAFPIAHHAKRDTRMVALPVADSGVADTSGAAGATVTTDEPDPDARPPEATRPAPRAPALPLPPATGPHRGKPREAASLFTPLARFGDCSLVLVRLGSAQMHQVRVHAAALGFPLLADGVYVFGDEKGDKDDARRHTDGPERLFGRHALHAWRIVSSGLELEAPLPGDFANAFLKKGVKDPEILLARWRKLDYS